MSNICKKIFRAIEIILAIVLGVTSLFAFIALFSSNDLISSIIVLLVFLIPEIFLIYLLTKKPKTLNTVNFKKDKKITGIFGPSKKENKLLKDYVVIDLETSGLDYNRCEIIEIGALKIVNSQVVDTFQTFVKPSTPITDEITRITGITNEMLSSAPSINRTLPQFLAFVADDVLIGHNITFDVSFLSVLCQRFNLDFNNSLVDTLALSRTVCPRMKNHKLSDMCKHFRITNKGAHRALTDCYATQELFEKLCRKSAPQIFSQPKVKLKKKYNTRTSTETKYLNSLLDLIKNVIADGKLTRPEVLKINNWLEENQSLCDKYPYCKIKNIIDNSLADGRLTKSELSEILNLLESVYCPDFTCVSNENLHIAEKNICITGEFKMGSEEEVKIILENEGAICKKNVNSKTDFVIIGKYGSYEWAYDYYGKELQKAIELNENGANIKILNEEDFWRLTQLENFYA